MKPVRAILVICTDSRDGAVSLHRSGLMFGLEQRPAISYITMPEQLAHVGIDDEVKVFVTYAARAKPDFDRMAMAIEERRHGSIPMDLRCITLDGIIHFIRTWRMMAICDGTVQVDWPQDVPEEFKVHGVIISAENRVFLWWSGAIEFCGGPFGGALHIRHPFAMKEIL